MKFCKEKFGKFLANSFKNCIFVLFLFLLMGYGHEGVHVAIAEYYHCVDIEADLFKVSSNCSNSPDLDKIRFLNSLNEIVGYGIVPPLYLLVFLSYLKYRKRS